MDNSEHNFRTISLISETMKMIHLDGKLLRQRTRQLAQKIRFSLWRMVVVADVSLKEYQQLHPKYNLQCQQIDRRPHFPPKFSPRFLRCLTKTFFVSSRDKCCLKRRSVATKRLPSVLSVEFDGWLRFSEWCHLLVVFPIRTVYYWACENGCVYAFTRFPSLSCSRLAHCLAL